MPAQVEPIDSVAGHIPGAVNHPFTANLDADSRFLPAAELRRRWLERLAGRQPQHVIAMCGSGVTACHNLLSLEVAGLPGAKLYAGSWSEWIRDPQRPIVRTQLCPAVNRHAAPLTVGGKEPRATALIPNVAPGSFTCSHQFVIVRAT